MNDRIHIRQFLNPGAVLFVAFMFLSAGYSLAVKDTYADFSLSGKNGKQNVVQTDTLKKGISAQIGVSVKTFRSVVIDHDNNKWFVTEKGIVSFKDGKWTLHNKNAKVPTQDLKDLAFEFNINGQELWIASPKGATVATLPIDSRTGATTYSTDNTTILNNDVVLIAIGKSPMRWFGTPKGISGFNDTLWLKPNYGDLYPEEMFQDYPITVMAANAEGDSLYVGTDGGGIARLQRNDVDGITGASAYAQWGPILLPSDKIKSIYIASDRTGWFGTDQGLARHIGNLTLKNWTVFTKKDGLADDFVQAITGDMTGKIWIDEVQLDESSGKQSVQFSFPVMDGATPIGSIVIGLDVAQLK